MSFSMMPLLTNARNLADPVRGKVAKGITKFVVASNKGFSPEQAVKVSGLPHQVLENWTTATLQPCSNAPKAKEIAIQIATDTYRQLANKM